jgi:hypothetical protein
MSFSLSCGGTNLFNNTGNPDTEEALLEAGLKYINKGDYDSAITALDKITSAFRGTERVTKAVAAAYAGKCGLTFFDFVNGLSSATASTPMLLFMNAFQNITVSPSYCDNAQAAIEARYGTNSALRSTDINFFLAVLGMAKVGAYLRDIADTDQDGAVDATFTSACTNNAANITDGEIKEVGSGLGLLLSNITAISAALAGNAAIAALNGLNTACGASCQITDPNSASWTGGAAGSIMLIRRILDEQDFGIMTNCNDATLVTCCP